MARVSAEKGSVIGACAFLIAYTIGTEFLYIVSSAGPTGFWPGTIMGLLTWFFLFYTGLLFLEVILVHPPGSNVVTICKELIGPAGAVLGALSFVLFNYWGVTTFLEFCANLTNSLVSDLAQIKLPLSLYYLLFFFLLLIICNLRLSIATRVIFLLVLGLLFCALSAFLLSWRQVEIKSTLSKTWYLVFFAIPSYITAYNYLSTLPTLSDFLNRDRKKIFHVLVVGLIITLLFYTAWNFFLIGLSTPAQIWVAFETGNLPIDVLKIIKENVPFHLFFYLMTIFSAAAGSVTTAITLHDFFADAAKIPLEKRKGLKKFFLFLAILLPAALLAFLFPPTYFQDYPAYFIGFAGAFFVGILPIWLVVKARYVLQLPTEPFFSDNKWVLTFFALLSIGLFYLEGVQILQKL